MDFNSVNTTLVNILMGCSALTLIIWTLIGLETIIMDIREQHRK